MEDLNADKIEKYLEKNVFDVVVVAAAISSQRALQVG